jgi:hypothetical protein
MQKRRGSAALFGLIILLALGGGAGPQAAAQPASRFFPETGHSVAGRFFQYWETHGGLDQQGYPLSDELTERDAEGQPRTVQYFERAVFEWHPEYAGSPYEVLLARLGADEYRERYGPDGAPGQQPSTDNPRPFPETGHTIGGPFRAYWEAHGGLTQQGVPLSDEFTEVSPLDGQPYRVQYFERAVFEYHREHAGTPYAVLPAQLGRYRQHARYGTLALPTPGSAGIAQINPQGSERYLIWPEENLTFMGYPRTTGINGLDVRINQPITITAVFGPDYHPALSGSIVVWSGLPDDCLECGYGLLGKDLATGATFRIGQGWAETISGRMVAWFTSDDGQETQLVLKNLDTDASSLITRVPGNTERWIEQPSLSEEYLVWSDLSSASPGIISFDLQSYSLTTGEIRAAVHGTTEPGRFPQLAVSGHYLVWATSKLFLTNLNTGETTTLYDQPAYYPFVRGNTVLWKTKRATSQEEAIWGLKLTNPTPTLLVPGTRYAKNLTIAGGWLVWSEERLNAIRLYDAFAPP